MKKLGPIEKVFEAWTALADGRISMEGENMAVARSSDDSKSYTIRFDSDRYSSDDNATYWRGYAGYPVIAVLMLQGRLPYDRQEAELWKNVNWKAVNTKYKNDYKAAVEEVARERGIDLSKAYEEAQKVVSALEALDIEIKRKI